MRIPRCTTVVCSLLLRAALLAQAPARPAETVVVTGAWEPVALEESDRTVHVFDVARTGGLLFESFAGYLKLDSSVDLRERAPNGVQSDASIRGGTFGQTLVLLNGIRLNDAQSAHHNMDLPIPLEAISSIEVLRGSGSTQYGADAVAGVIDIVTPRPEGFSFRLRAGLGNFGRNEQSGSITGAAGAFSEELAFSRDLSTGFRDDRDYRDLGLASISHLKSALGATDVILSLSDRPFGADRFYGNFNSWERTKGWIASARQELGSRTEVNFAYRRHTDLFVLFRDRPQVFTNRHVVESWEGDLRRTENLPAHAQLHYGVETFADSIDSNNLGRHSRVYGAGYVSYDIRSLKRFSFSAGLREDLHGARQSELSPTMAAGYWLSPRWKLRGSVSHAFRLPNYTDLYYHDPGNVGSPYLTPERAWNYEGGADWHGSGHLRGSFVLFQRRDTGLIDYVRNSPTDIFRATNVQRLVFTGAEAEIEWQPARGQVFDAQYTGLRGDRAAAAGVVSRYVFNYPVHSGVAAWQGSLGPWLIARTSIGVVERYAQSPYAVWDAAVARSNGRVKPYLRLTNLGDTVYAEIPGVVLPRRGIVGGILISSR